jgi:hypothetical protein
MSVTKSSSNLWALPGLTFEEAMEPVPMAADMHYRKIADRLVQGLPHGFVEAAICAEPGARHPASCSFVIATVGSAEPAPRSGFQR